MPMKPESTPDHLDCIIIGAGIAGLLAATMLNRANMSVRILDKGRGLGGRMATRRQDGAVFDHGAQPPPDYGDRSLAGVCHAYGKYSASFYALDHSQGLRGTIHRKPKIPRKPDL